MHDIKVTFNEMSIIQFLEFELLQKPALYNLSIAGSLSLLKDVRPIIPPL